MLRNILTFISCESSDSSESDDHDEDISDDDDDDSYSGYSGSGSGYGSGDYEYERTIRENRGYNQHERTRDYDEHNIRLDNTAKLRTLGNKYKVNLR